MVERYARPSRQEQDRTYSSAGLWLNESFATWSSQLTLNHIYPEWEIWTQYSSVTLQQALTIDSLHTSHPIEMDVKSSAEIGSVFDAISYQKGGSVLR